LKGVILRSVLCDEGSPLWPTLDPSLRSELALTKEGMTTSRIYVIVLRTLSTDYDSKDRCSAD
jgi:hypothetical protein